MLSGKNPSAAKEILAMNGAQDNPRQVCEDFCNTLQHTATHCNTLQHTATQ